MNEWMKKITKDPSFDFGNWVLDNIVTIIFWIFIILGMLTAKNLSLTGFFTELCNRFYRNAFLILSLIIPVIAGLGLNFGIVVGAIAGQLAIIAVRYWGINSELVGGTAFGGLPGLLLMFLIALPIAAVIGWMTGTLYNKTKGQEMIASLIVGYFGNGVYQFIVLFLIGAVIPVAAAHPMILYDGIGIRMSVDMGSTTYALDNLLQIPFVPFMIAAAAAVLLFVLWNQFVRKPKVEGQSYKMNPLKFWVYVILSAGVGVYFIYQYMTAGSLNDVRKVPVVLMLVVAALALFNQWIMNTKLGQDFRSCGMNQTIAEANGINVDRTRVIATIISTVLAAWGMIIYLQNMGTLNTYTAHNNVGYFSVAAILVGGASVDKATIGQAVTGCLLFHAMFILSPEIGKAVFGQAALGEYFRTFMVYGVIGLSLGLYVWRANKRAKLAMPSEEKDAE